MCNACGFFCCAWDGFEKCGCDHCFEPACHDDACWACGEVECCCSADDLEDQPQ